MMTTYKGLVLHLKFSILKWKKIHPNDEINTVLQHREINDNIKQMFLCRRRHRRHRRHRRVHSVVVKRLPYIQKIHGWRHRPCPLNSYC